MTKFMSVLDGLISSTRRSKGCRVGVAAETETVEELMVKEILLPCLHQLWIGAVRHKSRDRAGCRFFFGLWRRKGWLDVQLRLGGAGLATAWHALCQRSRHGSSPRPTDRQVVAMQLRFVHSSAALLALSECF